MGYPFYFMKQTNRRQPHQIAVHLMVIKGKNHNQKYQINIKNMVTRGIPPIVINHSIPKAGYFEIKEW